MVNLKKEKYIVYSIPISQKFQYVSQYLFLALFIKKEINHCCVYGQFYDNFKISNFFVGEKCIITAE
jgi:hypothetical protein